MKVNRKKKFHNFNPLKRSKSTQEVEINADTTNESFAQQDSLATLDETEEVFAAEVETKNENDTELGEIISAFPVR